MRIIVFLLIIACFNGCISDKPEKDFFEIIRTTKILSDTSVVWKNFGPGMSGYCEEFWCHPTDTSAMFMGPDMHVSYGTWDNGKSWHTIKDCDGLGQEMKRVLDIDFSRQNPDFGMAIDWNGWIYETTNLGHTWKRTGAFGKTYKDLGVDPNSVNSFEKGWYPEQQGTRNSELAIDPTNDNIWYVGAGDFWNVKSNHRSAANPNGIKLRYAAYGYIWKTTDKGKTWIKMTNGIPENTEVGKIIVNPNHPDSLIMATNVGLLISSDGGLSWKSCSSGLPNNLPRNLTSYYNPKSKQFVLYLIEQTVYQKNGRSVSSKGGIYKSVNGGTKWTNITGNFSINLKAIHYPEEVTRYYRTIAYWFGISQQEAREKFPELPERSLPVLNRLVVNPLNKAEIYISYNKKHDYTFGPGDVWKTENGGKTWFACARQGAYWKSGKDNSYWQRLGNPTGTNCQFAHLQTYMNNQYEISGNRMMAVNANGDVYIGIDQQTLKTSDHGRSWHQVDDFETLRGSNHWIGRGDSDLPGRFMLLETGVPGRHLLCSGEHGLWQTTDNSDWPDKQAVPVKQIEGQVHDHDGNVDAHSISTVAVNPKNPNMIYILSWRQEHRGKLRRTTDGGKTWEDIATIFDADNPSWRNVAAQNSLVIDPVHPENMYFCATRNMISEVSGGKGPRLTKGGYGFYRSFDGGYTWQLSNNGFPDKASVRRIVMDPDNPEIIYAALNDDQGGLFKTSNKGKDWERVQIPSVIKAVNNVFIDRNNKSIYISTGRRNGSYEEGGVWRSTNSGTTWKQIFKAPYVWQAETSPVNPKLIVISVAGQDTNIAYQFMNPGIYLSVDEGVNWKKINRGLGQPDKIVDVKPDPRNENVLWCASWGCGWFMAYLNGTKKGWIKQ